MSIELPRRGFILGLASLIAAPAVIRIAPMMPISTRYAPAYVPINWLSDFMFVGVTPMERLNDLKKHAWPRRLSDTWVDLNDHDAGYVRQWLRRIDLEFDEPPREFQWP